MRKELLILFAVVVVATVGAAKEPCVPHDDLSQFICKYGKPDVDDSTAYDKPRPPIVTRVLTYKKQRVRAAYIPSGVSIGDPPPYKDWKLFGFQDPKTNAVLSPEEVARRMGKGEAGVTAEASAKPSARRIVAKSVGCMDVGRISKITELAADDDNRLVAATMLQNSLETGNCRSFKKGEAVTDVQDYGIEFLSIKVKGSNRQWFIARDKVSK